MPNKYLIKKYRTTSLLYDILDYPWEQIYRHWRPEIVGKLSGKVLEAGVGTGKNLKYYNDNVDLEGVDLSEEMLNIAQKRAKKAICKLNLQQMDATNLNKFKDNRFDVYISTFMYCVMPDQLQKKALIEMARVLKPNGCFTILEMVYSKNIWIRMKQKLFAPLVELLYGARFDRHTLQYIKEIPELEIVSETFLKDDTYLMITGKHINPD